MRCRWGERTCSGEVRQRGSPLQLPGLVSLDSERGIKRGGERARKLEREVPNTPPHLALSSLRPSPFHPPTRMYTHIHTHINTNTHREREREMSPPPPSPMLQAGSWFRWSGWCSRCREDGKITKSAVSLGGAVQNPLSPLFWHTHPHKHT